MRIAALSLAILVILGFENDTSGSASAEVVIDTTKLRPLVLTIPVGQPVVFVNRSHWHVDVDFPGAPNGHTTFRENGRTWAVVSRPGAHPYVVSFGPRNGRHLHGVIEAVEAEATSSGPPTCGAMRVIAICIEP